MKAPVSNLKEAPQALLRAAENARKLAEQTGTNFVARKPSAAVSNKSK